MRPIASGRRPRDGGRSREEFIASSDNLRLPQPEPIDIAVPANRNPGLPHGG
jgi:hypothetical protein